MKSAAVTARAPSPATRRKVGMGVRLEMERGKDINKEPRP